MNCFSVWSFALAAVLIAASFASKAGDAAENQLTAAEQGGQGITYDACKAEKDPSGVGYIIKGFNPSSIVKMKDGSLMTESGQRSIDGGRGWSAPKQVSPDGAMGVMRMPNGDLGVYYAVGWTLEAALGDATIDWFFRWSSDEGKTWSDAVRISIPGVTMGLAGTQFTLKNGRVCLVTYSQFLSPMEGWGGSWGTYKGARFKTESEGHFGEFEVVRVYYTDDSGRTWKANKSWIMGWRQGKEKWTDSFVEASGVQLRDGRVLLMGRSLVGRLFAAESKDNANLFDYAYPTPLMSSDSPSRLFQDPRNGNLIVIWNQISRAENRKGFRRSRLSCAVSKDDGKTWENFKNLYAIKTLARRSHLPTEKDMTPVWGDDDVGELPEDFELWHYPNACVVGDEVFVGMFHHWTELGKDEKGNPAAVQPMENLTRIIPLDWFYQK